ncbi:MAG: hypothetical protein GX362_04135 [Methanosarcinaceae archaeon]|nr:hypothetical protein [Methanosarcinaceae archaeon]
MNTDVELQQSELDTVTNIDCSNEDIGDLTGIEYFTKLNRLDCSFNNLSVLDVSKNIALTNLTCSFNNLSTIDLSLNTALLSLDCSVNNFSVLDVSQNTALVFLECSSNNLSTLDVSKNTLLEELSCSISNLSALDLSQNTALAFLYCGGNHLTVLDLTNTKTDLNPSSIIGYQHYSTPLTPEFDGNYHKFNLSEIVGIGVENIQNITDVKQGHFNDLPLSASYDLNTGILSVSQKEKISSLVYFYVTEPSMNLNLIMDVSVHLRYIYTLNFDGNGNTGGIAPDQNNYVEGGVVSLPDKGNLVKTGYNFLGWSTTPIETEALADFSMPGENTTLYAVWAEKPKHSVAYDVNGGNSPAPVQSDVFEGETFSVASYTGSKTGYTFGGWNDGSNDYLAGDSYLMDSSDVIFTATWIENPVTVTVYYDVGDGNLPIPAPTKTYAGNVIKVPYYSGMSGDHVFSGWLYNKALKFYKSGDNFRVPKEDVVLIAQYSKSDLEPETPVDVCTVTYKECGDVIGTKEFNKGDKLTFDVNVRYNRGFYPSGWISNGKTVDENTIVYRDMVVELVWKPLPSVSGDPLDTSIKDVIMFLQYTANIGPLKDVPESSMIKSGFDLNRDGKINIVDVIIYLKFV